MSDEKTEYVFFNVFYSSARHGVWEAITFKMVRVKGKGTNIYCCFEMQHGKASVLSANDCHYEYFTFGCMINISQRFLE